MALMTRNLWLVLLGLALVTGCAGRQAASSGPDAVPSNQAGASEADTHFRLGADLLKNGDLDRAAAEFMAAIDADPVHRKAYKNLGVVYLKRC